jgi:[ribosomal protein S18]-alanine N-acetyltransferase
MQKIRLIALTDIPNIAQIESNIHSHPWSEKMFSDCFGPESDALGYSGFVLVTALQKIMAYLVIQIILDECHILTIGVDKLYQKQGLATQLLQHISINYPNLHRILLEVRASNQAAIQLYKKLGFQCIAERKNYYVSSDTQTENALIFEKIIIY